MKSRRVRTLLGLGLAAAIVVPAALVAFLKPHAPLPLADSASAPPSASGNENAVLLENLARLCLESGGELWKRAVLVKPSNGLTRNRCPDPPPGAKAVWEASPEYSKRFETCLRTGTPVARLARCVSEIKPLCAASTIHSSSQERIFNLVQPSQTDERPLDWQIEDIELSASWSSVQWTSHVWRITGHASKRVIDACVVSGTFSPKAMTNPGEVPLPSSLTHEKTVEVPVVGEFDKLMQWNCFGSIVTLRSDEQAKFMIDHGCVRAGFVPQGTEAKIEQSSRARCQAVHSVLESPKVTISCEGNDLFLSLAKGKVPLRPSWWSSVSK